MKKVITFFLLSSLLISCKKSDNDDFNISSINGWATIDFKTNYTIQIPVGYVGYGMGGFEGNTFYKSSADSKIKLSYGYCNSLFCFDFGDTLRNPIPTNVQVQNNYSKIVTLNQIEYFRQNSEIIGIFYYAKSDTANGSLYWKDNGKYRDALEVEFDIAKLDIVNKIIGTIKRK